MLDGQFSLDGYLFGHPNDDVVVLTEGWDLGKVDVRSGDKPLPMGDQLLFGRDYSTPGVWTFSLAVRPRDGGTVYSALSKLSAAWRAESVRSTPGAVSTLRYRRAGEERIVYGRPREFAIERDDIWDDTFKLVTCTFQLSDLLSYSAEQHELTLDLVNTSTATGLVFPTSFPWQFNKTTNEREGLVTLDSRMPAPFEVLIRGPITGQASDFQLSSTGWKMSFPTYLSPNGNIRVDTREGIARRNSQAFGLGSALTSYRARLVPGPQEIIFKANDPSYSSTATIKWRDVSATI